MISQLENLKPCAFDQVILLDTDMIVVADFPKYGDDERDTVAKIVDFANPSIAALKEIAVTAGMPVSAARSDDGWDRQADVFGQLQRRLLCRPKIAG